MEERRVATQDLDPAAPTRVAVEGALLRFTMVDTVPKATRTPPRVPIRARASECLLLSRAHEKTACCTCV